MNISDRDFDKVVAGESDASGPDAEELARIMRRLNAAYVSPIPPGTELNHLQAIRQANAARAATGFKTDNDRGFVSVLGPLKDLGAGLRRLSLVPFGGSTAAWALVVALFLVTSTGGLASAGVLPDRLQSMVSHAAKSVGFEVPRPAPSAPAVEVSDPAGSAEFHISEGQDAGQQTALESAEQAIAAAEQAQKAAQAAATTASRCMEESMAQISSLVNGILAATSQLQAQAVVTQAGAIGSNVKACSDRATELGRNAVGYSTQATQLAQQALQASPDASGPTQDSIQMAQNAARSADLSAGQALTVSRSIVDNVGGLATSLITASRDLQRLQVPPVEPPAAPPAASSTTPTPWNIWGIDYSHQIIKSFMGGAGFKPAGLERQPPASP